jgi:hypothetical protein
VEVKPSLAKGTAGSIWNAIGSCPGNVGVRGKRQDAAGCVGKKQLHEALDVKNVSTTTNNMRETATRSGD